MSLLLFTSTSLYYYHLRNLFDGSIPGYVNFLLLFFILLILIIIFYIFRDSRLAYISVKPLNTFLLLILILAVIPHSEYPPFKYFQQQIFSYYSSIGIVASLVLANLLITFIIILNFLALQDKTDHEIRESNISKGVIRFYRSSTNFSIIVFGFVSLLLSLLVYSLSILLREIIPTLEFTPVTIILIMIVISSIIFYTFNYFTKHQK